MPAAEFRADYRHRATSRKSKRREAAPCGSRHQFRRPSRSDSVSLQIGVGAVVARHDAGEAGFGCVERAVVCPAVLRKEPPQVVSLLRGFAFN